MSVSPSFNALVYGHLVATLFQIAHLKKCRNLKFTTLYCGASEEGFQKRKNWKEWVVRMKKVDNEWNEADGKGKIYNCMFLL